ncbi:hypothetical protein [Elizabethkingia ursingii]|uniref:hypothetical protein n=1 Tax=Elizabethkingia ursingii TaxID=1756150 RepID=UPI000750B771|nr:hypothetical protein [Elizabethkingia ursingii]KUY31070.1 hypothetical protein ATB96_12095 [Elizabethkingia ursingii]
MKHRKLDELRKEISLDSLNDDLQEDGLSWNLEDYKKDLPRIEKLYKKGLKNFQKIKACSLFFVILQLL